MSDAEIHALRGAVAAACEGHDRIVLAVSGGIDSMVLLDVAADLIETARLTVATFDHATGAAATAGADFVAKRAADLAIACVRERATVSLASEAALRTARWDFLRRVARARGASICTGHTEDDQIETVLMRLMRDAGARGLAGLCAPSDIVRPLIGVRRRVVERYAQSRAVRWIEDPSNSASIYHRNRVRRDLLPALRRANGSIDETLLAVGRAAAAWRRDVARFCDTLSGVSAFDGGRGVSVPIAAFCDPAEDAARIIWPELAGRVGAILDRRGLARLTRFTVNSRVGSRVQLSGGWEVVRGRNSFGLRQVGREATPTPAELSDGTRFGDWVFRADASADLTFVRDSWSAWLPTHAPLVVRPWQSGDAMAVGSAGSRRKVKHLLSAAGVTGHERAGWPVVLSGNEIVWVPGVRRTDATAARSGRPGLAFVCEYHNR